MGVGRHQRTAGSGGEDRNDLANTWPVVDAPSVSVAYPGTEPTGSSRPPQGGFLPAQPTASEGGPWTFLEPLLVAGVDRSEFVACTFEAGETLFEPGVIPEVLYVVRQGRVLLDGAGTDLELTLCEGMPLLLPELLDQVAVVHTARATSAVSAWRIDAERVRKAAAGSVAIRNQVDALRSIGLGKSTARLVIDEAGPTVEVVHTGPETVVSVLHRLDSRRLVGWRGLTADPDAERAAYDDVERGIHRAIYRGDGRLLALEIEGPWTELRRALCALSSGAELLEPIVEGFEIHGHLFELPAVADTSPEAIVCHCLGLSRADLEAAMRAGAVGAQAVIAKTGATTTCGGCAGRVAEIVGVGGTLMTLSQVTPISHDVNIYRFETPLPLPLAASKAGQHVVLSAQVGERWVHRPYTLTSPAGEQRWREIAVKHDPHGRMGRALSGLQIGEAVRLSDPAGEFWVDPGAEGAVVCLAGGIGVTPALAMARTFAKAGSERALHVELFNTLDVDVAFREELGLLADRNPGITVRFHTTFKTGRPRRVTVDSVVAQFPDAAFYVCGPPGFTGAMSGHLEALGVGERTLVEGFEARSSVAAQLPVEQPKGRRIVRWLTGGLLLAYLIQAVLGVAWPALDALQANDTYRLWSGGALAAYLGFQMLLGASRLLEMGAVSRWLYRAHRYAGLLAPVLLYAHARAFGFGYLALLSGSYLLNAGLGLADKTIIADPRRRERWARWWLPAHINLSMLLIGVVMFHVFVVLAYR